ncbi:MAG: type II toxin-antitoxin system PrlF family antitoxin [Firmicutes bacterium]|nr:type II toxin-antitoxin system PrlF family antitoxin [Bacillota bacterium]
MKKIPEIYYAPTLTAKRQVTVPMQICDTLGLKPGDKLGMIITPEGKVELINFDEIIHLRMREQYGDMMDKYSKEELDRIMNMAKDLVRSSKRREE